MKIKDYVFTPIPVDDPMNPGGPRKAYIPVNQRILAVYNDDKASHSLTSTYEFNLATNMVVVTATLVLTKRFAPAAPDVQETYTGIAAEKMVAGKKAIEEAQTSAWGRAFAAAGIGILPDEIVMASKEEMESMVRERARETGSSLSDSAVSADLPPPSSLDKKGPGRPAGRKGHKNATITDLQKIIEKKSPKQRPQ